MTGDANPDSIDPRSQAGFANGESYDRGRPTYAPSIVENLLSELGVSGKHGAKILDLGAGTGKFTELLSTRTEEYEIVAVEPNDGMRKVLQAKHLPRVSVVNGAADHLALDDGTIDAVICAQAFHWFAHMEALREIHRVLQTHGALGMCWNIESFQAGPDDDTFKTISGHNGPPTKWEAAVKDIVQALRGDGQSRFRDGQWREVFDEQTKSLSIPIIFAGDQLFSLPLGEKKELWEVRTSKEKAWERFCTHSLVAVLDDEERQRIHEAFSTAVNDDEKALDENGDVVIHGYTLSVWTTKIPGEGRKGLTSVERLGT